MCRNRWELFGSTSSSRTRTLAPRPLLRFSAQPSFEPSVTVELFPPEPDRQPVAYRLVCEVMGVVVDQGVWQVSVPVGEAERLVADLEALDLDPSPPKAQGLDGTSYTLGFGVAGRERCLSWWSYLPEAWDGIAPILLHVLALAGPRAERHLNILDGLEDPDFGPG